MCFFISFALMHYSNESASNMLQFEKRKKATQLLTTFYMLKSKLRELLSTLIKYKSIYTPKIDILKIKTNDSHNNRI